MSKQQNIDFSTLLAAAAHDMKNSLSLVINTLDEMMQDSAGHCVEMSSPLNRLRYEAKRVNNDLVQLLTLYKLEKDQYSLMFDYRSVYDFLEEQAIYFQQELDFNNIMAEVECPEDLEWRFDEGLLSGVMKNVINNALRYTNKRLKIIAQRTDDMLVISVEDDGKGYPQGMLTRNLEEGTGIDYVTGSTGLGLYFSSMIARVHEGNGREGYISISNGGSFGGGCFSIYLPSS